MCGIVGYYGPQQPKDVIISGLKALEYRGYDSAGVAILDHGRFKRVRAEGKLGNLELKLQTEKFDGHLGIGHTRWATHGKPSERNAHPHCVGGISIVHNGIIENFNELKKQLMSEGAVFESETDSELVAHLIHREVSKSQKGLLAAVQTLLPILQGAYSIVAVNEAEPDVMVAFKNGPPLILGVGEKEMIVASDLQAIMPYTQRVVFLEDHQIVISQGTKYRVIEASGRELKPNIVKIEWSPEQVQKGGYRHYMLKEIFEQPRAVAQAMAPHLKVETNSVELKDVGLSSEYLKQVQKVTLVACGTSHYAAMAGKYWIESWARIPVETDIASEFRYRHPVLSEKTLTVVISQSGETADTLAALRLVRANGGKVLSICNVRNSSIDREADGHLYMNAGTEIGVASTKAFSSTLALLQILSLALAKSKGELSAADEAERVRALLAAPSHIETVLAFDKFFARAAATLKGLKGFLYVGRGPHYPVALEGALKLKELAYMHAEGYAAGEMKHGPLALIDDQMAVVVLAPSDELYEKTMSNLEEAKARGGRIISLGTAENQRLKELSEHYLALPDVKPNIYPLLETIPLQLLAYHVANSLGRDVDQPRNLAKSVTVE